MITENQALILFEDYLAGRLPDEEGRRLLDYLESNEAFSRESFENLFVDYLLRRRQIDFRTNTEPAENESNASLPNGEQALIPDENFFERIESLARLSSAASPAPRPSSSEQHEDFRRFPFFPGKLSEKLKGRLRRGLVALILIPYFLAGLYGLIGEFSRHRRPKTVAHMVVMDNAVWEGDSSLMTGDSIRSGTTLRLRSGSCALKMLNGAEITLDGPAELELRSQTKIRLNSGFLSANITPQAKKILVETPRMTVSVLGTAFWIKTSKESSEVHLVRGKLKIDSPSQPSRYMDAGEAFSLNIRGESRLLRALSDQFLSSESLVSKSEEKLRRYEQQFRAKTSADPSWLIRLDFQRLGRTIPNYAVHGAALLPDVRVVGCSGISGRNPNEAAVLFRDKGDVLTLDFPKKLESLTLACRVRIGAEVRHRVPLLMSDDLQPGAVQWMIAKTGVPVLNVTRDGGVENYSAPSVFTREKLGRWVHLAVTLDAENKRTTWYVDGTPVGSGPIVRSVATHIGEARIGNWSRQYDRGGREDDFALSEFVLFERVLSGEEILNLFENNYDDTDNERNQP